MTRWLLLLATGTTLAIGYLGCAGLASAQEVKTKLVSSATTTTDTYDVGAAMNLSDGERLPALQKPYSVEVVTEAAPTARLACANLTSNSPMIRVVFSIPRPVVEPRFFGRFYAGTGCQGVAVAQSNVSCPSCPIIDNSLVMIGKLTP